MASKKVTVEVDIDIDVNPSLKALRQLKAQLKDTAAGSEEFKKITKQIKDVEDALEEGKVASKGWGDILEEASGPLGLIGKGIRQFEIGLKSLNTVAKSTIIGFIAAAVIALVEAFRKNEVAMKKLEPIFIQFEKILGGIFRAFEPVLDIFIEMAMTALPYITKGIGMFYSGIYALFTFIKTAGGAVIDFFVAFMNFDFVAMGEATKKLFSSFSETTKSYTDSVARFTEGTKEMTKTEKENAEELAAIEKKKQEDRQKALEDKIANMQQNDELDLARLEQQKAIALDAAKTEEEKLAVEEKYAKLSYNIRRKDISDKRALYAEGTKEYKDYTKQLIELDTEYINTSSQNAQKRIEILQKQEQKLEEIFIQGENDYDNFYKKIEQIELDSIEEGYDKSLILLKIKFDKQKEELELGYEKILASDEKFYAEQEILFDKAIAQGLMTEKEKQEKLLEVRNNINTDQINAQFDLDQALLLIDENYYAEQEKLYTNSVNKERAERVKAIDEELKLLGLRSEVLLQGTRAYFDNRREIIDASERKELESAELTEQQITAIQRKYAEQRKQLKQDEWAAIGKITSEAINSIAAVTGALASSYDLEAEESEKAFNKRKKLQKATAYMSAASGIIQILTQPSTLPSPFDWIVKSINAIALGVATKVQIDKIDKTEFKAPSSGGAKTSGPIQVQRRAKGGMINGPGTSTSDSIPAMLSNGEFVVNARATETFEPLLRSINNFGLQPRFAAGGMMSMSSVNRPSGDNLSETLTSIIANQPIRTYVTSNEITNQQQFDRVIKTRSMI